MKEVYTRIISILGLSNVLYAQLLILLIPSCNIVDRIGTDTI